MENNKNTITIIICLAVFIILMLIVVFALSWIKCDGLRIFVQTILSTIATVSLANVAWEVIAKKRFADSLLNQVKISQNIAKSGIDSIYIDFHDIDWKHEFANTNSFTAAFVYAYSWRSQNDATIKEFVKKRKHRQKMRIIVPDPEIDEVVSDLDRRFGFETGKTKMNIEDCIKYYCDLSVPVYLFEGTLQASYYLMDKTALMSFFSHTKAKGTVPAIKANLHGNMYEYIKGDVDALVSRSDKVKSITIEINKDGRKVKLEREGK